MDWLKNLLGKQPSLPQRVEGQNPIHAWLDAFDIPWRDNRGDLIARYGITKQSDRASESVEIDVPRKPIKGLIRPIYTQLSEYYSPYVPAGEFIGDAYYEANERANIHRVAGELSHFLGPTAVEDHLNTLRALWTFDRARVRLLTWPRDKQRRRSSWEMADDRDPCLQLGCYITIYTGFLPNPTEEELEQLQSFTTICSIPPSRGVGNIDSWNTNESELEFIRNPAGFAGTAGLMGMSFDRRTLIFQTTELFVLKMAKVHAIYVERTRPAKGPGGSKLQIEVLTDYDGVPLKKVTVCEAPGVDDLSEIGELISKAIAKPLKLNPYYSDC